MSRLILRHLSGSKAHQESGYDEADLNEPLTLGRDPANRIVYGDADDAVSRQHARIERRGAQWVLVDLGSSNGSYLNGSRIQQELPLQHGDTIQLGRGGPEFGIQFDPPPPAVPKLTRLVAEYSAKPTREIASEAVAAAPIAAVESGDGEAPKRVGRATVERLIGDERQHSARKLANVMAIVVGLAGVFGAWQIYKARADQEHLAEQSRQIDAQRIAAEAKARELADRANLPARVKADYAAATVLIEVAWRLTATQSGQQIYHGRLPYEKDSFPAYVRMPNGSYEPLLQLEDTGGSRPIGGVHSGSGFVVSDNGLILTNRHVAAAWFSTFQLEFPGVVVEKQENEKKQKVWKVVEMLQQAPQNLQRWVPARSQYFGTMGVSDASAVTGKLDSMSATFANSKLRVPAMLGTISPEHDVALVKIDAAAGQLKKVDLRDSYETIKSGEPVVVLGYPGISAKSYVITRSQDSFVSAQDVASVTDVSVNPGIVSKIVPGKAGAQPGDYFSTAGDAYEMSINSTGPGNSGGPVFDGDGKVIGIFSAGAWGPGVALTRAVPIRYGLELLDPTRAALARR